MSKQLDMTILIAQECDRIKEMLIGKNKKYGNSAINPVNIFSQADAAEQLKVRIDDKLSRVLSNQDGDTEDTRVDLIGYLVLQGVLDHISGAHSFKEDEKAQHTILSLQKYCEKRGLLKQLGTLHDLSAKILCNGQKGVGQ